MNATSENEPTIQQLFDLTGKTAMLTGASGWLGSSFSRALAEGGATVVCSSRDVKRAEEAAARLPSPGGAIHQAVQLDHMNAESLERGFRNATAMAGDLDILVNNGISALGKDLTDISFEEFAHQQTNNAGYFHLSRLMRNHVVHRGAPASIILIGSMYGVVGSYPDAYEGICHASPVSYHTLKGGTVHMTRHLAAYWAKDNVRVNCICPGAFPPKGKISDELIKRLCTKNPMRRMGRPYELKGLLLLLASDAGSYITGQNILVDGGWTAW